MTTTVSYRVWRRYARNIAVILIDAVAAGLAMAVALALRMNGDIPAPMMQGLEFAAPLCVMVSALVFYAAGLHRRLWRYLGIADLTLLFEAATAAVLVTVLVLFALGRVAWMPASVPIIQWFVLVVMLGTIRLVRFAARNAYDAPQADGEKLPVRSTRPRRAIIAGAPERVELLLRQIEHDATSDYRPIGILDDSGHHVRLRLRGVPVLGTFDALEHVVKKFDAGNRRPECLLLAHDTDRMLPAHMIELVTRAQGLGLTVARTTGPARLDKQGTHALHLEQVDLSALLGRPQAQLDNAAVTRVISGRKVLVTGAGGTIGRELVHQIAALGPSELILLDAGEFNLYNIDMEMRETYPDIPRTPVLCSIRQRASVMQAFAEHRPELVFHAAALKHVPLVETNPCAGVQTNVLGTRNVADAALLYGARAVVQISSDKAVNPVGVMGATKRLGELYCQALDLEGGEQDSPSRFMTVRFGNVLGSSGSLIPLFQRQLVRRLPLTVTHPEIERYFMTVHEAVQLVLQSTACALEGDVRRGRIFVLDMGQPIKIIDIARRMITLAGLEPGKDVKIDIVGLRPGEKLYEELFDQSEKRLPSTVPGVFEAEPTAIPLETLHRVFDELANAASIGDSAAVRHGIMQLLYPEGVAGPVPAETATTSVAPAVAKVLATSRPASGLVGRV